MDKLVALVPNVYYHVIGRMLPGASVLACLVFFPATRVLVLNPDGGYMWTVILIGGYTLGLMLTASSAFVFNVLLQLYSAPAYTEHRKPLHARIGDIARKDSAVAVGFWKMTAENALFENLFIGSVCLAVVDAYSLGLRTDASIFWACLLLGLYFVSLERKHLLLVRLAQTENILNIKRPAGADATPLGV
jgi:hypothetical protein